MLQRSFLHPSSEQPTKVDFICHLKEPLILLYLSLCGGYSALILDYNEDGGRKHLKNKGVYQSTQCHFTEDKNLYQHHCENFTSQWMYL